MGVPDEVGGVETARRLRNKKAVWEGCLPILKRLAENLFNISRNKRDTGPCGARNPHVPGYTPVSARRSGPADACFART